LSIATRLLRFRRAPPPCVALADLESLINAACVMAVNDLVRRIPSPKWRGLDVVPQTCRSSPATRTCIDCATRVTMSRRRCSICHLRRVPRSRMWSCGPTTVPLHGRSSRPLTVRSSTIRSFVVGSRHSPSQGDLCSPAPGGGSAILRRERVTSPNCAALNQFDA